MEQFLEKYTLIKLIDNYDWTLEGVIAVNNKHNLDDFRKEWNRVRGMLQEERLNDTYDDDDITYITEHISNEFDWAILGITNFEVEF